MRGSRRAKGRPTRRPSSRPLELLARKLCEVEGGAVARAPSVSSSRPSCSSSSSSMPRRSTEQRGLALLPENKHAKALLATSQQKAGKKRPQASR